MELNHRDLLKKCLLWGVSWGLALSTAAAATSLPGGPRSVKIIFKQGGQGSFSVPSGAFINGTVPTSGDTTPGVFAASQFYRTNQTSGTTPTPLNESVPWLSAVTLTLGGTSNTNSSDSRCGGFSSGVTTCSGVSGSPTCSASDGYFRVSEYDCDLASAVNGTGLASDGVAIKVFLNRDATKLGATENLLLVLEYQASGLMSSPKNPSTCVATVTDNTTVPPTTFTVPDYTNPDCVDQAYALFARTKNSTNAQRLQVLIPPQGGVVNNSNQSLGGPIQTKQMIVPLSSLDSTLDVLQISRIFGLSDPTVRNFGTYCTNNSPLCLGVVFYSLSIFRI